MPMKEEGRLYGQLAWLWPIISAPSNYLDETTSLAEEIRRTSRREVRTLLNLGCGGGHHDYGLKRYFQVVGIDLSEGMLDLARKLNPEAEYMADDIRSVRLGTTFDAVTIFDAINHMTTESDLLACFQTAAAHLEPGGILLTIPEVTSEGTVQNQTFCSTHQQEDVQVTFIENHFDTDPSDTLFEVTLVFLIRRGNELSIEIDRHVCGVFPRTTWWKLLQEAGFTVQEKRVGVVDAQLGDCPVLLATKST